MIDVDTHRARDLAPAPPSPSPLDRLLHHRRHRPKMTLSAFVQPFPPVPALSTSSFCKTISRSPHSLSPSSSSSFVPSFSFSTRRSSLQHIQPAQCPFRSVPLPPATPATPLVPIRTHPSPYLHPSRTHTLVRRRGVTTLTASAALLAPTPLLIAGAVVSFALSAALGANDVANSLGTAVGTGAIRVSTALVIGAVMEFAGAVLFGSTVTRTISSGVVTIGTATLASPVSYMCGMLAVLVGCTVWMAVATKFGLPVSSTHSVVGALIGLGVISGWGISTAAVQRIVLSWFLSPLIGGTVALVFYRVISFFILGSKNPTRAIRRSLPILAGGASFVLASSILSKSARFHMVGPDQLLYVAIAVSLACTGIVASLATTLVLSVDDPNQSNDSNNKSSLANNNSNGTAELIQANERERDEVEKFFKILQVLTACLLSFSHGSNDVSNAIGPFAAMYSIWRNGGSLSGAVSIPFWCLLLGGLGISSGLALFGRPVMETVGQKITILKPTMGFCVEFSTALTVLVASKFGLPVSTTHTLIGCIVAIGLSNGDRSRVNKNVIMSIAGSWGITLPFSAVVTILFYAMLRPFVPAVPALL